VSHPQIAMQRNEKPQPELGAARRRESIEEPQGFATNKSGESPSLAVPRGCAATLSSSLAGAVRGNELAVRPLYAASRSNCSAMTSSPCRSHSLRHAFACLRASFARLRYSSALGITLKRPAGKEGFAGRLYFRGH
jgi:hypothetical protein